MFSSGSEELERVLHNTLLFIEFSQPNLCWPLCNGLLKLNIESLGLSIHLLRPSIVASGFDIMIIAVAATDPVKHASSPDNNSG